MSRLLIWVPTSNPRNSIFIQSRLLATSIKASWPGEVEVIHPQVCGYKERIRVAVVSGAPVLWQYAAFDPLWKSAFGKFANVALFYHNITPVSELLKYQPLVALRSLLGAIQMRCIPRPVRWLTCSGFNIKELRRLGFTSVVYCPNIVVFCQPAAHPDKLRNRLLYVGRIAPNKRCTELLRYATLIAEQIREPTSLGIVGDGKSGDRYLASFMRSLDALGQHPFLTIEWHRDAISDTALSILYRQATLYISTASHEGFGLPACEAIGNGTPALYLACGGTETVLNGIGMVPRITEHEFPRRACSLLRNEDEREHLLRAQVPLVRELTPPAVYSGVSAAFAWLPQMRG